MNRSFDNLASFNGYVNIHERVSALDVVIAQGNIGSNATGTPGSGLDFVAQPRSAEFALTPQSNVGELPTGIGGRILFQEISDMLTVATLDIRLSSATGASLSHPAHIHANSAEEGGPILTYLAPLDASDPATRSSIFIEAPIDSLASMDGYINIHESLESLDVIISQGNIGSNAN